MLSRIVSRLPKTTLVRNNSCFAGSAIGGPPTVKVPFAEKMALGAVMIGSSLIIPAWVLVHMEDYKQHE